MAKAKNDRVEMTVTKKVTADVVVLELTKREAAVLKLVLGRVAGSPNTSARYYIDEVYQALDAEGVPDLTSGGDASTFMSRDAECINFINGTKDFIDKNIEEGFHDA